MKRKKQKSAGVFSMPVGSHIGELRNRLSWVVAVFIVGAICGYIIQEPIISFLNSYIKGSLYYTSPAGNFNFIMKISALVGVIVATPVLVYHIIKYIQPAVKDSKRYRRVWLVALLAFGLALSGVAFALWVVLPLALHFFAGFSVNGVEPLLTASEYLTFVMNTLIWFALLFQLPLVMLFINRLTPLGPRKLLKYERHIVVLAMVSTLILPFAYDPVTQFIVAAPVVVLYNLSILLIVLANRSRKSRRQTTDRPSYKVVSSRSASVSAEKTIASERPLLHSAIENKIESKSPATHGSRLVNNTSPSYRIKSNAPIRRPATSNRVGIISDFGPSKRPVISSAGIKDHRPTSYRDQVSTNEGLGAKPVVRPVRATLDGIILSA